MRTSMTLAVLAVCVPLAAHASCSDDTDALASKYGITATLPHAGGSAQATTDTLAQTGGVIAPPATGDIATITPSLPSADKMQTAPSIAPQTADGSTTGKTAKSETNAATNSQAASLLQAAHAASLKGDEATCNQRLSDARAMLEKTETKSQ